MELDTLLNNKIWLEANTEQSESNPGRSLGDIRMSGTAVWKTVPLYSYAPSARYLSSKREQARY